MQLALPRDINPDNMQTHQIEGQAATALETSSGTLGLHRTLVENGGSSHLSVALAGIFHLPQRSLNFH